MRPWMKGLLAAVPLVPIAIAVALGGGGAGPPAATSTTARRLFTPVPSGNAGAGRAAHASGSPHTPASGALVALLTRATLLRAGPGGRAIGPLPIMTPFGSPQALLVVARAPGWLGVLSPVAGNGQTGWIPAADARLGRVDWTIEVSLGRRTISVLDGNRVVRSFRTAIGAPDAPTPLGRFAVTDRLLTGEPTGPYGCCILALSARAPHAIQDWDGGDRIAIHATPETASVGEAVSHGCLRVYPAEARWLIDHIPLGTPVVIRA